MARMQRAERPSVSEKHPNALKTKSVKLKPTSAKVKSTSVNSKYRPLAVIQAEAAVQAEAEATTEAEAADGTEACEPKEKKKRKHSRKYLFNHRVKVAQTAVRPIINKQAGYRILKWAKDQIQFPDFEVYKFRFKPSAVRAFHMAAEQVTHEIFTDAHESTRANKMVELQGFRVQEALEVWSKYNGGNLVCDFKKLMEEAHKQTQN